MLPYQIRALKEKEDLDRRLKFLRMFLYSSAADILDQEDVRLLMRQEEAMQDYSDILGVRINRFAPNFK